MNSKIIAAGVIAALIIAGASVYFMSNNDDKGWYAWDPTVGEVDYTKITATPQIIDSIEEMYQTVYGELPSTSGVVVPEDEKLVYESLVTDTAGGIQVRSVMSATSGNDQHTGSVYFTDEEIENMKIISYSSGVTDSYVEMLGTDNVWNTVVAAGNSTWKNYADNDMENWSTSATGTLGSEYTISTENLLSYLNYANADTNGEHYCVVVWGYITDYDKICNDLSDAGYSNVDILCIDYYSITSFEYLLSVVDALGQIVGIEPEENVSIDDFQLRLYVMMNALESNTDEHTVYLERADRKSPGADTLAQLCFDVLKLENINTVSGTTMVSDEIVSVERPDVIFFTKGDTRTMDEKMRVTTV